MVLTRRDDRYEALSVRRERDLRPDRERRVHRGREQWPQPARRPVDRQVRRPRRPSSPHLHPHRTRQRLPVRLRRRPRSCSTLRPRPTCASSTPPRTTGKTRAAISASTVRSGSCRPARRWSSAARACKTLGVIPEAARLVDTAPTIAALLGCAPRPDGNVRRGAGRRRAHRRARSVASARSTSSAFLFDGTNSNVLYDMCARGEAPNVAAPDRDGHRVRTRRDVVAARPSRSRTTRRSSPVRTRAITASSTTRGSIAPPANR